MLLFKKEDKYIKFRFFKLPMKKEKNKVDETETETKFL